MPSEDTDILLVEDNPADAELTLHALRQSKLVKRIHHARDGAEALDFLFCRGTFAGRVGGLPRLVLLDLKLPKIDGLEVLAQIKNNPQTKALPVIMLTSSKEDRDLLASYRNGVNSYIQKPVDFGQFQKVVHQLGLYWLLLNTRPPLASGAR